MAIRKYYKVSVRGDFSRPPGARRAPQQVITEDWAVKTLLRLGYKVTNEIKTRIREFVAEENGSR